MVSAAPEDAEMPLAGSAVDFEVGEPTSAEVEVAPLDSSDLDLIEAESVEVLPEVVDPEPEELTPEQQEIKRLRDLLALREGKNDSEPEVEEIEQGAEGNILIHFLEDGLSALGKVWVRGEELEFVVGSRAHKDTYDRRGKSWLDLRNDEFAQVERFGKIMFRSGPWPGKSYVDGTFEPLRGDRDGTRVPLPSEEELARAEKLRKRRAAPHLPAQV